MIPFIAPMLIGLGMGGVVKMTIENGTWDEMGKAIDDISDGIPEIGDPLAGARDMMDKMAMFMIVSTVSIISLALVFTYLYPKWK